MRNVLAALTLVLIAGAVRAETETQRWAAEAARVTITRDDHGIAHVHGATDADAVFGSAYAQAEDDFNRIEMNYVTALGRTAEIKGEAAVWTDLRRRLFIDPEVLKADYAKSPPWLQALMTAWADGLNDYLATHPKVTPKVIRRFEPWMALSFVEGSIGGDDERIGLNGLAAFYGGATPVESDEDNIARSKDPGGSNGIAIAPSRTVDGHALLLINPHTSFFFRAELQMTSDEGLNAYGASTWGQFFFYQGFNAHAGWMHTSTGVDNVDEFGETIVRHDGKLSYRYGAEERPVATHVITIRWRAPDGSMTSRAFVTYATHHGPIVRASGGKWIAVAMLNNPIPQLEQSWLRTRATDYADFMKVAELKANSSNNTLFADDKGEIAFLSPQFVPKRDDRFDYAHVVDGADPATDWHGLHALDELPSAVNPASGWAFNTNNAPWSAAGPDSPRQADFPKYMDTFGQNYRGFHAIRLLLPKRPFTLETLRDAAFDSDLPAFDDLLPPLIQAWDDLPAADPLKAKLTEQIGALRAWDHRWSAESVPTALAILWGDEMWSRHAGIGDGRKSFSYITHRSAAEKLQALAAVSDRLTHDFGDWRTAWGTINRFQRVNDDIDATFSDAAPSIPVPFASGQWGSLAAFSAKRYPGTAKYYGTSGNSFVAIVEFGPRVRAVAVTAGGESGHPGDPHFDDQAERYASGALREVYFYPDQLVGHVERVYHPGS
jgi:acyl-homoserine-lactone acylase